LSKKAFAPGLKPMQIQESQTGIKRDELNGNRNRGEVLKSFGGNVWTG
jgi:hypothetical protein